MLADAYIMCTDVGEDYNKETLPVFVVVPSRNYSKAFACIIVMFLSFIDSLVKVTIHCPISGFCSLQASTDSLDI